MTDNTTNDGFLESLMRLGIKEREAKICFVLKNNPKGMKQIDIGVATYMYQPDVSLGLKALIKIKWVAIINNVEREGRGRPYGVYALVKSWNEIVVELKNKVDSRYEELIVDIDRLAEME